MGKGKRASTRSAGNTDVYLTSSYTAFNKENNSRSRLARRLRQKQTAHDAFLRDKDDIEAAVVKRVNDKWVNRLDDGSTLPVVGKEGQTVKLSNSVYDSLQTKRLREQVIEEIQMRKDSRQKIDTEADHETDPLQNLLSRCFQSLSSAQSVFKEIEVTVDSSLEESIRLMEVFPMLLEKETEKFNEAFHIRGKGFEQRRWNVCVSLSREELRQRFRPDLYDLTMITSSYLWSRFLPSYRIDAVEHKVDQLKSHAEAVAPKDKAQEARDEQERKQTRGRLAKNTKSTKKNSSSSKRAAPEGEVKKRQATKLKQETHDLFVYETTVVRLFTRWVNAVVSGASTTLATRHHVDAVGKVLSTCFDFNNSSPLLRWILRVCVARSDQPEVCSTVEKILRRLTASDPRLQITESISDAIYEIAQEHESALDIKAIKKTRMFRAGPGRGGALPVTLLSFWSWVNLVQKVEVAEREWKHKGVVGQHTKGWNKHFRKAMGDDSLAGDVTVYKKRQAEVVRKALYIFIRILHEPDRYGASAVTTVFGCISAIVPVIETTMAEELAKEIRGIIHDGSSCNLTVNEKLRVIMKDPSVALGGVVALLKIYEAMGRDQEVNNLEELDLQWVVGLFLEALYRCLPHLETEHLREAAVEVVSLVIRNQRGSAANLKGSYRLTADSKLAVLMEGLFTVALHCETHQQEIFVMLDKLVEQEPRLKAIFDEEGIAAGNAFLKEVTLHYAAHLRSAIVGKERITN